MHPFAFVSTFKPGLSRLQEIACWGTGEEVRSGGMSLDSSSKMLKKHDVYLFLTQLMGRVYRHEPWD